MSTANVARDLDVLRAAVGDDKLSYAGFSYGSYVGQTYANMFPSRVRALVVDGVIDPLAWSTGRGDEALTKPFATRRRSHAGAQQTLDEFFRLCDEAGPDGAFSGAAAARFAGLAERARQAPLHVILRDGCEADVGYSDVIGFALGAMYSSTVWRDFAQVLADVEQATTPAQAGARSGAFVATDGPSPYPNLVEGGLAVACEDSDNPDAHSALSSANAVYAWTAADSVGVSARALTRTRSASGVLGAVAGLSQPGSDAFDVQVAVEPGGRAAFAWLELDPGAGTYVVKSRTSSAAGVLGPATAIRPRSRSTATATWSSPGSRSRRVTAASLRHARGRAPVRSDRSATRRPPATMRGTRSRRSATTATPCSRGGSSGGRALASRRGRVRPRASSVRDGDA